MSENQNRREFIKQSVIGTAAAVGAGQSLVEAVPMARMPETYENGMPVGHLGKLKVSRLFIGCNQVSGYSHGRDLRYLPELMRNYQTDEKVLDTWELCQEQGINTLLSDPFEKPVSGVASISVVVKRAVRRGAPCLHCVIPAAHEQIVPEVPVLPNRGWPESLARATDGVVVAQDSGRVVIQLEIEAGNAVGLVTNQVDGPPVEWLSRQGRVRVVAPILVDTHIMATIVRLDRIILGP